MPLWRNKVEMIAAWGGHSFPVNGESDYKTNHVQLSLYNIPSPKR